MPSIVFLAIILFQKHIVNSSCSGESNIKTTAQLASLAQCTSYNGKVIIENYDGRDITIPSLEYITELKIHKNNGLSKISIPSLKSIEKLEISNHTDLYSIDLGRLRQASKVELHTNPKVRTLKIENLKSINILSIEDMDITSIEISEVSSVEILRINANKLLSKIKFPDLTKVKELFVSGMNWEIDLNLPKLSSITGSSTIHAIKSINLKELKQVKSDLVFDNNNFNELNIGNLEFVEGTLRLTNNDELNVVNLDHLEKVISTLTIEENQLLKSIKLPSLVEVRASLKVKGPIKEFEIDNLNHVGGSFEFNGDKLFCSKPQTKSLRKKVKGKYQCIPFTQKNEKDSGSFKNFSQNICVLLGIFVFSLIK